eukprot:147146-Pyramimonas_sp.AAC.2
MPEGLWLGFRLRVIRHGALHLALPGRQGVLVPRLQQRVPHAVQVEDDDGLIPQVGCKQPHHPDRPAPR